MPGEQQKNTRNAIKINGIAAFMLSLQGGFDGKNYFLASLIVPDGCKKFLR